VDGNVFISLTSVASIACSRFSTVTGGISGCVLSMENPSEVRATRLKLTTQLTSFLTQPGTPTAKLQRLL